MKDFKQNTKMSATGSHYCSGGKVKKYADGGVVNRLPEIQAESRRMQREGVPEKPTPEQQPAATMTRIAGAFGAPLRKAPAEIAKRRDSRGADAEELQRLLGPDVKVSYKRGGAVKRGSKK